MEPWNYFWLLPPEKTETLPEKTQVLSFIESYKISHFEKHDSTRSFERSRNVETLQTFVQVSDKTSEKYTQVFHTNGRAGF